MTIEVTTLARVTALIKGGTLKADAQATVSQLIAGVSADFESFLDRQFDSSSATTEYFAVESGVRRYPLKAYPVASITTVHFDPDSNFNAADLLDADDYTFDESGYLWLKRELASGDFVYPRALKVVYQGGMADDTAAFIAAFPDIAHAGDLQVAHLYHRRNDLGLRGVSVGGSVGGSVQQFAPLDFLPMVKKTLLRHRRMMAG